MTPSDYSYFRAEGASLTAIETVVAARAEIAALERALADRFGARSAKGWADRETGRYKMQFFHFESPNKAPDGWVPAFKGGHDTDFAMPPEGSADAFTVANVAGLLERAARRETLEKFFATGDMPMRTMPANSFTSMYFVRFRQADAGAEKPPGQLSDPFSGVMSVGSEYQAADPMSFMKLEGDYYIRVPNKKGTDAPVFTPPDAVAVDYDAMRELDKREQAERFNRVRANAFNGPRC